MTITSPHQSTHHSTKTLITSCYNIFTMHKSDNFNTPQSVFSHYPPFIDTHSGILSMASATFISYMGINSYSTSINMNFELSSFGSITYTINCNNHHKYFKHIELKKGWHQLTTLLISPPINILPTLNDYWKGTDSILSDKECEEEMLKKRSDEERSFTSYNSMNWFYRSLWSHCTWNWMICQLETLWSLSLSCSNCLIYLHLSHTSYWNKQISRK